MGETFRKNDIFMLGGCIILCLILGWIGSLAIDAQSMLWYSTIKKAALNPPNWVFAPVWTILYIITGIALYIIVKNKKNSMAFICFILFLVQLLLNVLWSYIFFANSSLRFGLIDIILMDIIVLLIIIMMWKISLKVSIIMIIYILWLAFATYLNGYAFIHN